MPSRFSGAGKNTIRFKSCSNLVHAVAFKVLSVYSLYNFCLFWIDDEVAVRVLRVSKKTIVVDLYLALLVAVL